MTQPIPDIYLEAARQALAATNRFELTHFNGKLVESWEGFDETALVSLPWFRAAVDAAVALDRQLREDQLRTEEKKRGRHDTRARLTGPDEVARCYCGRPLIACGYCGDAMCSSCGKSCELQDAGVREGSL